MRVESSSVRRLGPARWWKRHASDRSTRGASYTGPAWSGHAPTPADGDGQADDAAPGAGPFPGCRWTPVTTTRRGSGAMSPRRWTISAPGSPGGSTRCSGRLRNRRSRGLVTNTWRLSGLPSRTGRLSLYVAVGVRRFAMPVEPARRRWDDADPPVGSGGDSATGPALTAQPSSVIQETIAGM
jgi:hypothetical protein